MRWDFRREGLEESPKDETDDFVCRCTDFLQRGLSDGNWVYWIGEVDGEIVSHIFVQRVAKVPKPERPCDQFGYLTNVYTKPHYRGQGIGSTLLKRVCEWAKEVDLEFVITWPSENSREFYGKAGFVPEHQAMSNYQTRV